MRPESGPGEDDLDAREATLAAQERLTADHPSDEDRLAELADERGHIADARDDAAQERDDAASLRRGRAHVRDEAAAERDRTSRTLADDADPGFPDRFMSARDVDASAGDRADALDDGRHARADRERARDDREHAAEDRKAALHAASTEAERHETNMQAGLEGRTVIGQAQGLLMAQHGISAEEAFSVLVAVSQETNVKLRECAERIVRDAGHR